MPIRPGTANDLRDAIGGNSRRFVLPNSHYVPATRFEPRSGVQVTRNICFNLVPPPLPVVLRKSAVFLAAVPKTSIHEDSNLGSDKDNINCSAGTLDNWAMESET